MARARDTHIAPVYRYYQFIWDSPCILGTPCPACVEFALKKRVDDVYRHRFGDCICKRATPAKAAFRVTKNQALTLVWNELAVFVHSGNAIQLTFTKVPNLRDCSSKVDEELVFAFLAGSESAKIAIYEAWKNPPPSIDMQLLPLPVYPFV